MQRIAIIGGGISGLSAAFRLRELDPSLQVTLFEAAARVGGSLQTTTRDGYLVEHGADMFTTREPWALNLCRRLEIERENNQARPRPPHRVMRSSLSRKRTP